MPVDLSLRIGLNYLTLTTRTGMGGMGGMGGQSEVD